MARAKGKNHRPKHEGHPRGDGLEHARMEMNEGLEQVSASARRQGQRMQRNARDAFDTLDVFGGPIARLMDQNLTTFQKMLHAVQQESLNFMNRRFSHTSRAIESSRDRQGISGLVQMQQEWILDLARDCSEQTKRFAELMREIAGEGTSNLSNVPSELVKTARAENRHEHRAAA